MGWVWLLLLFALVSALIGIQCASGMGLVDRISVALEIADSSHFVVAEGFEAARIEDPDLVAWVQSGRDCLMLFRSQHDEDIDEVVDVSSGSFHPGLVVRYRNGMVVQADGIEQLSSRARDDANRLLRRVHALVVDVHGGRLADTDGFRL